MDRTAGCVTGGEEIYLLCDKVQKGKCPEYCKTPQGVLLAAVLLFSCSDSAAGFISALFFWKSGQQKIVLQTKLNLCCLLRDQVCSSQISALACVLFFTGNGFWVIFDSINTCSELL